MKIFTNEQFLTYTFDLEDRTRRNTIRDMESMRATTPAPPTGEVVEVERTRISPEVYKALVKTLPINLGAPRTELEAAFQVGIEAVLSRIRDGWLV